MAYWSKTYFKAKHFAPKYWKDTEVYRGGGSGRAAAAAGEDLAKRLHREDEELAYMLAAWLQTRH